VIFFLGFLIGLSMMWYFRLGGVVEVDTQVCMMIARFGRVLLDMENDPRGQWMHSMRVGV